LTDTIILVEGQEDIQILKSIITDSTSKIITFDFQGHRKLNQEGINHELAETYFSQEDISRIDNQAVILTTSWYKHNELSSYLEYQGLNFGSLLQIEFLRNFFLHLKRMQGIINVIEKEKPKKIYCCFLGNFIKEICKTKKIEVEIYPQRIISTHYFDTIEIPLQIKGKIFSIKISRKHFLILKNIVENLTSFIFNFKPNLKRIKKNGSILLLDFNPILYEDLLKSLSKSSKEIILLNQRRPAAWNLESIKILKNSKCKILQLDNIVQGLKISEEQKNFENKLNLLWSSKQKVFENIFSINDISFWNAIKDNFIGTVNNRSQEFVKQFLLIHWLVDNIQINSILEWAHTASEESIVIFIANKMKIPIVLLQHGLYILNERFEKYNPILPLLPTDNVLAAVWGDIMKQYIIQHKIDQNQILVSGSPRHDIFFKKQSKAQNNNTILIAGNGFFHNNFNGNDSRSYDFLESCLKKICEIIKKYPDKKLIVKLIPTKLEYDMATLVREIDPKIPIFQQQNILELMESCHCVISLNYSTVLLDAMILNKPTLVILPERQNFEDEIPVEMKTVLHASNISDLERAFDDIVSNEQIRNELIQKGKQFVEQYMENRGTASENIYKILDSL
jgi:hypothetical protein